MYIQIYIYTHTHTRTHTHSHTRVPMYPGVAERCNVCECNASVESVVEYACCASHVFCCRRYAYLFLHAFCYCGYVFFEHTYTQVYVDMCIYISYYF